MHRKMILAAAAALCVGFLVRVEGQAPAPQTPAPQAPAAQAPAPQAPAQPPVAGRGGRGQGRGAFPAQQRPQADPATIERGGTLYGINCRLCHGPDLRGGDMGGVNLLRSPLVLNDQNGELIYPIIKNGKNTPGQSPMPPLGLSEEDSKAVAAYIHSVAARMAGQGGPPPGEEKEINIVVGNAAAGKQYFDANCASCHSATGDLAGIAARIQSPMQLQNTWVSGVAAFGGRGGRGGGRGGRGAAPAEQAAGRMPKPTTVTVTTADGQRLEGRLVRIDDFLVTLAQADGTERTISRSPKVNVQITDPLAGHKQLWTKMTDDDIHNVTAYLVTLK